jgi:hypothetical protein
MSDEEKVRQGSDNALRVDPVPVADEIRVNLEDLSKWLVELRYLRKQVTELQARGTEMAMERQRWRSPQRRAEVMEKHCKGWGGVSQAIVMQMLIEQTQ